MSRFLYENHRGSPTLILLNVLGVLGVLYVPNVLHVPHTCASYMCFMCFIRPWTHRWPAGPCFLLNHKNQNGIKIGLTAWPSYRDMGTHPKSRLSVANKDNKPRLKEAKLFLLHSFILLFPLCYRTVHKASHDKNSLDYFFLNLVHPCLPKLSLSPNL